MAFIVSIIALMLFETAECGFVFPIVHVKYALNIIVR
ncbi:MAG: hypothetical protein ACJAWI_000413 [Marinomonas primoryensis]|jgi:hypothetical protein